MTSHSITSYPVAARVSLRGAAAVLGGASVVGVLSQVIVPLPFTPVPISLGTFGVLLVGGALGPLRGALSLLVYLVAGVLGVPWFASWEAGWGIPSLGYVFGYVAAAYIIGRAIDRPHPSTVRTLGGGIGATLAVYLFGLPWLMIATGVDLKTAALLGVAPFLVGDAIKVIAATAALRTARYLRPHPSPR